MSPLLLYRALASARFSRRMSYRDSMHARYPIDYYRPVDHNMRSWLRMERYQ